MFYTPVILSKKGQLARVWLAAHWDKKLTKAHVFETNIEKSVEGILSPKVKLALRTTGHLLLGVVRIYSRKAKYLLADCNEAFVKIKMAFRPGMVDLPEESKEAAVKAITLPEVFHDFDTTMPELNDIDIQAQFSLNQSRAEEITMREDYGNLSLVTADDGFGDMGFGPEEGMGFGEPAEFVREQTFEQSGQSNLIGEHPEPEKSRESSLHPGDSMSHLPGHRASHNASAAPEHPLPDVGLGHLDANGLLGPGLFDEVPVGDLSLPSAPVGDADANKNVDSDDDHSGFMGDFGPPSVGGSSDGGSRPGSPPPAPPPVQVPDALSMPPPPPPAETSHHEQTTLLHNEDESFALAPVDASALKGWPRHKRKRKLIVDEVKNITGEEMRAQLSDTSDIVTTLDLAPPTKRLMHWKETGGVEKLFALDGRAVPGKAIFKLYQRHLTSRPAENEDLPLPDDHQLGIEPLRDAQAQDELLGPLVETVTKRGRKRKSDTLHEPPVMEPEMPHAMIMHPLPQIGEQTPLQTPHMDEAGRLPPPGMQMANMGYEEPPPGERIEQPRDVEAPTTPWSVPQPNTPFSEKPNTPFIDLDFPMSVGPVEEEQAADETYEQYEERVLNKRALHMYSLMKDKLQDQENVYFSDITHRNNRKQVAQKFYTLLVLKKQQAIEIEQQSSYGDIAISRGGHFEDCSL